MKEIGIGLWAIGLGFAAYAMFMFDVSYGSSVNMDLQQRQLMIFLGGLAGIVSGIILHASSYVVDELRSQSARLAKKENTEQLAKYGIQQS